MANSDFSKHRKVEVTIRPWRKEKKKEKREESSSFVHFKRIVYGFHQGVILTTL